MPWTKLLGLLACLVWCPSDALADERGWAYLIGKLLADGVSRTQVSETFQDPRIERFTGLLFSPYHPREPRSRYRRFLRPKGVAAARRCHARYRDAFESATRQHGVPAGVLTAVLVVESNCGANTGSHIVLARLARLAMANAPENLQRVLDHYADREGGLAPSLTMRIRERARKLEGTFYPEVRALFTIAERSGVDPLDIRGSSAGAFGYPQFLPTSYLAYGIDGNGDGRVSLEDPSDAIASCAHYFVQHGWRSGMSRAERRRLIWEYNHSDAYVDTILRLAARIEGAPAPRRRGMAKKQALRHRRPGTHTTDRVRPPEQPVISATPDRDGAT